MQKRSVGTVVGSMLLASLVAFTGGCGSSSSADVNSNGGTDQSLAVTYNGSASRAAIGADNANAILSAAFGGAPTSVSIPTPAKAVPGAGATEAIPVKALDVLNRNLLESSAVGNRRTVKASLSATPVGNVTQGTVSGTMTASGSVNSDGTGSIGIVFSNYNNGDGYTYDGKCTFTVTGYDTTYYMITDSSIVIARLTAKTTAASYSMSGTISGHIDPVQTTEKETFNIAARNDTTNGSLKTEAYCITRTFGSWYDLTKCSESRSGRVYIDSYGYVDLSQSTPLVYNHFGQYSEDIPESGGPLLLTGAGGTKIRMTPISLSQFQMEVDTNGDDTYEISRIINWASWGG